MKGHGISLRAWCALVVFLLALGGAGVAIAQSGSSSRSGRHSLTAHHTPSFYSHLVAKKRASTHRLHPQATGAASGQTYAEMGVTIGPPSSDATAQASSSAIKSGPAALSALQSNPAAAVYGSAFSNGNASASLQTVTESAPVTSGVTAGTPYSAWVVTATGPPLAVGGTAVGTTTPSSTAPCTDIAIYDVQTSAWSELFQSC